LASRYPHLIASSESPDESLILQIDPKGKPLSSGGSPSQPAYAEFSEFLRLKYGRADFRPVELSFNSHDRTVTPAFVRSDLRSSLAANLATLFTGDSKSTVQERIDRQKLLEGCSAIGQVYYYYPRLSVDFSSSFLPVSAPDHLSYLVLVVRLKEGDTTSERPLRFLDITPKDADLVGFSRGDFNQSLQLTASASTGNKVTGSQAVGQAPLTTSTGKESSLGASTGATFTEGFATKLVDAIERRSTGVLEKGRTFFADFRAIREVRIAGTYNFDLMLEVPSTLHREGDNLISNPVQENVVADIFLIGVVRHVYDRGHVGVFNRVPESENDDVYEQVILQIFPDQPLWTAPEPWIDKVTAAGKKCEIKVLTNREDAVFFAVAADSGKLLASGTGKEAALSFEPQAGNAPAATEEACAPTVENTCGNVLMRFLPVIVTGEKGSALKLEAAERTLLPDGKSPIVVTGEYIPAL